MTMRTQEFSAQDIALSIPEVTSLILQQLPTRDLLLAQRISKFFATLIQTAPALQEHLFFRPLIAPLEVESVINPLLQEVFKPWLGRGPTRDPFPCRETLDALSLAQSHGSREAFKRKEASWSRMLITQPPIQHLEFLDTDSNVTDRMGIAINYSANEGLRMGKLFDLTILFVPARHMTFQFIVGGCDEFIDETVPDSHGILWPVKDTEGQFWGRNKRLELWPRNRYACLVRRSWRVNTTLGTRQGWDLVYDAAFDLLRAGQRLALFGS